MSEKTQRLILMLVAFTVAGIAIYLVWGTAQNQEKEKKRADAEVKRLMDLAEKLRKETNQGRADLSSETEREKKSNFRKLLVAEAQRVGNNWVFDNCGFFTSNKKCDEGHQERAASGEFIRQALQNISVNYPEAIPFGWTPYLEGLELKWKNEFNLIA